MSQQIQADEEALNEVNVIPLADLSLVLLIILMVMSPMVSQALIQITAGSASAALAQEDLDQAEPETPVIVSCAPGVLKINGDIVPDSMELVRRLEVIMPKRKDKSVIMTASPELLHGEVVGIMDLIKRHGGQNLVMLKWDPMAPGNQPAESDLQHS